MSKTTRLPREKLSMPELPNELADPDLHFVPDDGES
jgi:hypothetical protein